MIVCFGYLLLLSSWLNIIFSAHYFLKYYCAFFQWIFFFLSVTTRSYNKVHDEQRIYVKNFINNSSVTLVCLGMIYNPKIFLLLFFFVIQYTDYLILYFPLWEDSHEKSSNICCALLRRVLAVIKLATI